MLVQAPGNKINTRPMADAELEFYLCWKKLLPVDESNFQACDIDESISEDKFSTRPMQPLYNEPDHEQGSVRNYEFIMNRIKSEEQISVPDSETSVDYYVTTVNNQTPTKAGSDINSKNAEDTPSTPIVVSVDRAGSVKVRIRKKSKRRKKKSNLALDENGFHVSDDGILLHSSGSDENRAKMPRRSSSLSEKDLHRNSSRVNGAGLIPHNESLPSSLGDSFVRRRMKKKPSFNKTNHTRRRGVIIDSSLSISQPAQVQAERAETTTESSQSPKLPAAHKQWHSVDSSEPVVNKRINRKDALATINAFMVEVEEATTVAKQQEGERRKDPTLRKSRSLNELMSLIGDVHDLEASDYLAMLEQVTPPAVSFPTYNHQKSTSFDRQSTVSGSVFISDRDNSIDEIFQRKLLAKTPSADSHTDQISPVFSAPTPTMNGSPPAEFNNDDAHKRANSELVNMRGASQTSINKGKHFDFGLSHLEQVCKLLEQIGELRQKNQSLVKRVDELETEVKTLKENKDSVSSINLADLPKTVTVTKRTHPVGRFKDALYRTNRKSSVDKTIDSRAISQPMLLLGANGSAEKHGPFSVSPDLQCANDRRALYSNLSTRRRKRHPYSHDDLDLPLKNKWKFWKGTAGRSTDQPTKNQVLSSIKAENTQGTAFHLKSASVTLDTLLSSVDDDFTQKLATWQDTGKNNKDSKLSDRHHHFTKAKVSRPMSMIALPTLKDGSLRKQKHIESTSDKEGSRKKRGKREKEISRKFTSERRSSSFDRVEQSADNEVSPSRINHSRSMSASADFHKSLPSILLAPTGLSHLVHIRRASGCNSSASTEWNGLQRAFPTTLPESEPLPRVSGSGHSRLSSPLRKLKNNSKRNSWSHTKFANSVYLPNSDFMLTSNLTTANSIGDQLTLQLDPNDVEGESGDSKAEASSILPKAEPIYKKHHENEHGTKNGKKKGKHLPSPLARYHAEHGARSFRRSKRVEILRLSSCEVLASAPLMAPLKEEERNLCQSLPNLAKIDSTDKFFAEDTGENLRRFTVTVIGLKKYASKKPVEITQSAPSLLVEKVAPKFLLKPPISVQRSSSCREMPPSNVESRRRAATSRAWNTKSLLRSRRKTASVSSDTSLDPPKSLAPVEKPGKLSKSTKKRKNKTGSMFNRLISPITKSSSMKFKVNDGPDDSPQESPAQQPKKTVGRIFSFRSRSSSTTSKTSISPDKMRVRANTADSRSLASLRNRSKPPAPCEVKQKQRSHKIAEISERLTDDSTSPSRQINNPVPIKKGIVSRLSKRFARHDKGKDEKKTSPSSANPKNFNFLSAKSKFETRVNNNTKSASLGRLGN